MRVVRCIRDKRLQSCSSSKERKQLNFGGWPLRQRRVIKSNLVCAEKNINGRTHVVHWDSGLLQVVISGHNHWSTTALAVFITSEKIVESHPSCTITMITDVEYCCRLCRTNRQYRQCWNIQNSVPLTAQHAVKRADDFGDWRIVLVHFLFSANSRCWPSHYKVVSDGHSLESRAALCVEVLAISSSKKRFYGRKQWGKFQRFRYQCELIFQVKYQYWIRKRGINASVAVIWLAMYQLDDSQSPHKMKKNHFENWEPGKSRALVEVMKMKAVFFTFTGVYARSSPSENQPFPACLFS